MYDLVQALSDHDLPTLRIIGEWYELDLTGHQKSACVKMLSEALSQIDMPEEITYLPPEESSAFLAIIEAKGRAAVALYERNHGTVRQMGPGRMEREEPWLDPVSPAEALWYRGFLYRGFEDDESNLEEYYYLPNELMEQFGSPVSISQEDPDHIVSPLMSLPTPSTYSEASGNAVDDLIALLASAQNEPLIEEELSKLDLLLLDNDPARLSLLYTLAWDLELLRPTDQGAKPTRKVVQWLNQSREFLNRDLLNAWSRTLWSELFHTPGIECEAGSWEYDPTLARAVLLAVLPPDDMWYRISDLVAIIKDTQPDFQRPGSNYDTWYVRDLRSGEYLAGFNSWDFVEGRQLVYTISSTFAWLGLVDLAHADLGEEALFRLTPGALDWMRDEVIETESITIPIVVRDDAIIVVPFNANSYHRFQVARIADGITPESGKPFVYKITPSSLARAQQQGIEPARVMKFLKEASGRPLPASTHRAIERWTENGTEGRVEKVVVLRVRDAEILDTLRANPKTRPFISEALGDLAVALREDEVDQFRSAAAQLGLLLDEI